MAGRIHRQKGWDESMARTSDVVRKIKETDISLYLNIDGRAILPFTQG